MKKKLSASDFSHKVFTVEGGIKEYNKNQQTIGALKLAAGLIAVNMLRIAAFEIKNFKTNRRKLDAYKMSRM